MMKLGRCPVAPERLAGAPQLVNHMHAAAPVPPVYDTTKLPLRPGLYGNDQHSNCTAVGLANAARAAAARNGFQIAIGLPDVMAFYSASTGYVPTDPSTDQGGVELDVLGYQLRNGFRRAGADELVGAFATFDPSDRRTFAQAMVTCSSCYIGIDLAAADLTDTADDPSVVWDTVTPGDQTPDPDNGHCVMTFGYTGLGGTDLVRIGTWGIWKLATWQWVLSRTVESHVVIWRQLMPASGHTSDNLDYAGMHAANMAWNG
jgi:hypothetical protein